MRVLLITHSLATGGTDRVAVHIANGFARRFETTLLHVRKPTAAGLVDMIDPAVQRAVGAIRMWIEEGISKAMSVFNAEEKVN